MRDADRQLLHATASALLLALPRLAQLSPFDTRHTEQLRLAQDRIRQLLEESPEP